METMTLEEANRKCREAKAAFEEADRRKNGAGAPINVQEWLEKRHAFEVAMTEVVRAKGLQPQP